MLSKRSWNTQQIIYAMIPFTQNYKTAHITQWLPGAGSSAGKGGQREYKETGGNFDGDRPVHLSHVGTVSRTYIGQKPPNYKL